MHPPPTGLPVEGVVDDVRAALAERGIAVLRAPPGAGKTTVVPLRLLDEPRLGTGSIVVLEPRRIAARAAAGRMAELLGERVGDTVGHRTRDDTRVGPTTRVEVVTEGILVRRIQDDPALDGVGAVVLDEVHERSIHTDLALALTLDARSALCPDLRVLAMSATPDTDRLRALLADDDGPAPVVASEGRGHPVDLRWVPGDGRTRLEDRVAGAVRRALSADEGDVLAFLPGAAEIRRTAEALGRPAGVDVLALHGSLPRAEQDRALAPSPAGRRRVVLSTDVAESSLTVPGVRIVVDAGRDRVPRLDPRTGLTSLETVTASQASADQRAGRAGRISPGVAYRLWSEAEHATRPRFSAPEITQVDLAPLALDLARWGAPVEGLRFADPPPAPALSEARSLLVTLGLLDGDGRTTGLGRRVAGVPVHPRLGRMVVDGAVDGHGWEACLLAAALDERDVLRGRPHEVPADAGERLRLLGDEGASHPRLDRDAVRRVRRRARQLARRADVRPGPVDADAAGPLLALAFPDRIAQLRSGLAYRLRNGAGAALGEADDLTGRPFLAVAAVDRGRGREADGHIRMAAAIDRADVEHLAADAIEEVDEVGWDDGRDDLRRRVERRVGALVLSAHDEPVDPGPMTVAALLERVRVEGLDSLRWTEASRSFRDRAEHARRRRPEEAWPALDDDSLLASLEEWLAPMLVGARGRRDLDAVDLSAALRALVGHRRLTALDRIAPARITLVGGREVVVDYGREAGPTIRARAQDLYGTTVHPTVDEGREPVTVEVLSPAGRPVQVTADLPGFWAGSWAEVRKEMAGRYPKHDWPTDPARAAPRSAGSSPRR